MSAYHWIEPESVHNRVGLANGMRTLTPPFILPNVSVSWVDGIDPSERDRESKRMIWHTCQQALQNAYKSGEAGELFDGARGVWCLLGTHVSRFVYVVKGLGEVEAGEASVLPVNSNEARLPEDVIRMGAKETPDPEEHLYMNPPPATNGCGHH